MDDGGSPAPKQAETDMNEQIATQNDKSVVGTTDRPARD